MIVAGLMSGTSLDGVDVALTRITGKGWKARLTVLGGLTRPYPPALRRAILGVSNRPCHTADIARLHYYLGHHYAACLESAVRAVGVEPQLIGCHGQTIFHDGKGVQFLGRRVPSTLQIGESAILAERFRVPVINNFRAADIAAGGTGAPLAPYADYLLFRHPTEQRVALNIGGIANLTHLPADATSDQILAFDTGPGNMVVDQLIQAFTSGKAKFDRGGRMAASGEVHQGLLKELLKERYYRALPPKSAGREQYGAEFVARFSASGLSAADQVATATALTAATIAIGCGHRKLGRKKPIDRVIVSGGGVHNQTLLRMLQQELPEATIESSAVLGVDPGLKEAAFFALLAYESIHGRSGNLPAATGARRPVPLGQKTL